MRAARAPVFTLVWAALSACEFTRPLDPHPDVVALQILLVSGESEARMLVVYPHRERDDGATAIAASLRGPGWTAGFSSVLPVKACHDHAENWAVPTACLGAVLPEAVEAGGAYHLDGTAPLGTFTGETKVPAPPLVVEPTDSSRVPLRDGGRIGVPVRYAIGSEVGTLLAEALDVFATRNDGTEGRISTSDLGFFPQRLDGAEADTVWIFGRQRPVRFSLVLAGIGRHFTNFIRHTGTNPRPHPWSFGIEGEGVYGYFDGLTRSRGAHVFVR